MWTLGNITTIPIKTEQAKNNLQTESGEKHPILVVLKLLEPVIFSMFNIWSF